MESFRPLKDIEEEFFFMENSREEPKFPKSTNYIQEQLKSANPAIDLPSAQSKLDEAALKATKEVGPRTYRLTGLKDENNPTYWVIGCQGSGGLTQRAVAELMNKIAVTEPDKRPDFILFGGDNFYNHGVNSPTDPAFTTHFDNMYGLAELQELCKIRIFLIDGNHDANFQMELMARLKSYIMTLDQGRHLEYNQSAHTFVPDGKKYYSTEELLYLFTQEVLNLNQLQQFNMPFPFYSLIAGKTQLFCLDSNFLVQDFIELISDDKEPISPDKINQMQYLLAELQKTIKEPTTPDKIHQIHSLLTDLLKMKKEPSSPDKINQIQWLFTEFQKAKAEGREIHFALHHAPRTSGKRAETAGHDSKHYLTEEQIIQLNKMLGSNTTSYNEFIYLIFEKLGLKPNICLAAHDHFICLDDDRDSYLVLTNGAGGGTLQIRKVCKRHPAVKELLSQNGFNIIKKDCIETYTTSGFHLVYDTKKHEFIRKESADEKIEQLRSIALMVRDKFFNALKEKECVEKQNSSETEQSYLSNKVHNFFSTATKLIRHDPLDNEIKCADEFAAFFNQHELPDYATVINYLSEQLEKLPNKKEQLPTKNVKNNENEQKCIAPFYVLFQEEVKKSFAMDLKSIQEKLVPVAQNN